MMHTKKNTLSSLLEKRKKIPHNVAKYLRSYLSCVVLWAVLFLLIFILISIVQPEIQTTLFLLLKKKLNVFYTSLKHLS